MKYTWKDTGNGIEDGLGRQLQKLARNMNENKITTRYRYLEAGSRFICFIGKEFRLQKLANVQDKHLLKYTEQLIKNGKSHKYIKNELSGIRYIHNQLPKVRYELLDGVKFNRKVGLNTTPDGRSDRAWTEHEFRAFCQKAYDTHNDEFVKIFRIVKNTGMRLDEVCTLRTCQVREAINNSVLKLYNTKGGKPREIQIDARCKKLLVDSYKTESRNDYMYVPKVYTSSHTIHKYEKKIQRFIYNHREKIQDVNRSLSGHNVSQDGRGALTFHGLRHMYARNRFEKLKQQGISMYQAKKIVSNELGHGRIEVTDVYLGSSND